MELLNFLMRINLSLSVTYLSTEFRLLSSGRTVKSTEVLVNNCFSLLGLPKDSDGKPTLSNPCLAFKGIVSTFPKDKGLVDALSKDYSMKEIRSMSPRLEERRYGFGGGSLRAELTVEIDGDLEDISTMWERTAYLIAGYLARRLNDLKISREERSRFFSEVYFVREPDTRPTDEQIKRMLSPLKISAEKPEFEEHVAYDRTFLSRDGIALMIRGKGKKSTMRSIRKMVRGFTRTSVDFSLAQTVFYYNPRFWTVKHENWSALNGLLVLNPRVVGRLASFKNNPFGAIYGRISSALGVPQLFNNYQESLWSPLLDMRGMFKLFSHLFMLGVPHPKVDELALELNEFEHALLEALAAKEVVDNLYKGTSDYPERVAKILCRYFNRASEDRCVEGSKTSRGLMWKLTERLDHPEGLTVKELKLLLSTTFPKKSEKAYRKVLRDLVKRNLLRSRIIERTKKGKRGRGRVPVEVFEIVALRGSIITMLDITRRRIYELLS